MNIEEFIAKYTELEFAITPIWLESEDRWGHIKYRYNIYCEETRKNYFGDYSKGCYEVTPQPFGFFQGWNEADAINEIQSRFSKLQFMSPPRRSELRKSINLGPDPSFRDVLTAIKMDFDYWMDLFESDVNGAEISAGCLVEQFLEYQKTKRELRVVMGRNLFNKFLACCVEE